MQLFYFPDWLTIMLYIIVWPLIQFVISMIGNWIPDRKFNIESRFFDSFKWEQEGKVYEQVFKIRKWKRFLPDGAKAIKVGFEKGELKNWDKEYLKTFIVETCRAETVHWFQILPFWIFGLWSPTFVIWIMLGYAILVNVPCIIAQRYNRPRLKRVYFRKYVER